MGFCTKRNLLLAVCVTQLILTVWRQVFDFLGYMWGPILANFFQILFVIFGFFGVCQYRAKYTITYSVWCFFWCAWNIFIICFYLNVGVLDKDSDLLNLGTGSVSWWESNGPGCKPIYHVNLTTIETVPPWLPPRPNNVTDCFILYHHLEALQAAVHVFLSILGLIAGISISRSLLEEDDSSPANKKSKKLNTLPLYSIEYCPRRTDEQDDCEVHEDPESRLSSPRPMTPRRVKRRSVNSRGTAQSSAHRSNVVRPQYYNNSIPHLHSRRHTNHTRSSTRSSGRHRTPHQNPVTRLIEQQQKSMHQAYLNNPVEPGTRKLTGHCNPLYQQSSTHSLDQDCDRPPSARSTYSNYHGTRAFSYTGGPTGQVPQHTTTSSFLSHGPPAYNMHPPNDSETVI